MNLPKRWIEQSHNQAALDGHVAEQTPTADSEGAAGPIEPHPAAIHLCAFPPPPGPFWGELNATIDEFFAAIEVSRERIAHLSEEVARRDGIIEALEAQVAALRARLGVGDVPVPMREPAEGLGDSAADNTERRGIWRRLRNLERAP